MHYHTTDVHSAMLNVTSRLAVSIQNLPPWETDWNDSKSQRSRCDVTVSDILPSAKDGDVLKLRAINYTMSFLVTEFAALKKLNKFVPHEPYSSKGSSSYAPMKIFKDEKISETRYFESDP